MVELKGDEEFNKRLEEISKMDISAMQRLMAHLAAIEELCKKNNCSFQDLFAKAVESKKENQKPIRQLMKWNIKF
jgi:hypothetical protein